MKKKIISSFIAIALSVSMVLTGCNLIPDRDSGDNQVDSEYEETDDVEAENAEAENKDESEEATNDIADLDEDDNGIQNSDDTVNEYVAVDSGIFDNFEILPDYLNSDTVSEVIGYVSNYGSSLGEIYDYASGWYHDYSNSGNGSSDSDNDSDTGSGSGTNTGSDTGAGTGTNTGSDTGAGTGSNAGSNTGSSSGSDEGSNTGSGAGSGSKVYKAKRNHRT